MSQLQSIDFGTDREDGTLTVVLRDGTVATLRPLQRGETAPLLAVFADMSADSRALRYLTGLSDLPRSILSVLSDVDGDRHVAWLASVAGEPAGIARYVPVPGCATTAEVSFEVVDDHHGRGLGTVLLDVVTTVAAARGVRRIQATTAPANAASRRLIDRLGVTSRVVDGLVESEGPLSLLEPSVVDRSAVVRLACEGSWDEALDIG